MMEQTKDISKPRRRMEKVTNLSVNILDSTIHSIHMEEIVTNTIHQIIFFKTIVINSREADQRFQGKTGEWKGQRTHKEINLKRNKSLSQMLGLLCQRSLNKIVFATSLQGEIKINLSQNVNG